MDEILGGREAQRQQTEKEAGGDTWRGMEITKRRGRDGEIITDPETEEGKDGHTERKRQRQRSEVMYPRVLSCLRSRVHNKSSW